MVRRLKQTPQQRDIQTASKQRKYAQNHTSLGTFTLTRDATTHLLERPKSKSLATPNADQEAVEQQESSFTDGGNEKWYSHFERQSDTFRQNTLLP